MFGSDVLDIAIGLVFVYFLLSLLSLIIAEFIARIFALRSSTLYGAIRNLLSDPDDEDGALLMSFWKHPLIKKLALEDRGLSIGVGRGKPSYIPASLFALALLDVVGVRAGIKGQLTTASEVRSAVGALDYDQLRRLLLTVIGVNSSTLEQIQTDLAQWFDEYMDAVSGWYKRKTQLIILALGLILAAALNADSLAIVDALSVNGTLRETVVAAATKWVAEPPIALSTVITPTPPLTDTQGISARLVDIMKLRDTLAPLNLPIGWIAADPAKRDPREVPSDSMGWLNKILGLLVTGLLVSLGAPFWFDFLNRLVNLRATGKPPEKVTDVIPASDVVTPAPAVVTDLPKPAVTPQPGAEINLQRLADEAVQYVGALKTGGQLKLREDDVATARLLTQVTERGLDVTDTQIRDAVRDAFKRLRTG